MSTKEFWKFNKAEFIMDMMLILYAVFFNKFLNTTTDAVFSSSSPIYMYIFFILLCMFMPWYMGIVYARYRKFYGAFVAFIPVLIMILVMTILTSFLFAFNENTIKFFEITRTAGVIFFASSVLLLFFIIRAFYVGYKTEKDMLEGNSFDAENEEYMRHFFFSFGISASFIISMMYFAQRTEHHDQDVFTNILIMLLIIGGGLLMAFIAIKMLTRLQNYFPLFIIGLLICWNWIIESALIEIMKLATGGVDKSVLVIMLIALGVIPFRLVLLFSPPLRGINLLIGIIAMYCYIHFLTG